MRYASGGFAITPSDSDDLPGATTAGIVVGTAGTITVTHLNGSVVQHHAAVGIVLPVIATRVWSTGTAAAGISGLVL